MSDLIYDPLNLEEYSFRLLRLIGGNDGQIRGELFNAWLDVNDDSPGTKEDHTDISKESHKHLEYEALSYTWGGNDKRFRIEVNGTTMPITENLFHALYNLRYPSMDRILWIDAICIDQDNDRERTHQVGHMSAIYRGAENVLIWLGTSTHETTRAFQYMQHLEKLATSQLHSNWKPSEIRWQNLWEIATANIFIRDDDEIYVQGLRVLLSTEWFYRVWIIQEVVNARRARVCCGKESVSARFFPVAVTLESAKVSPNPHCQAILDIMPGPMRNHSWYHVEHDLNTLLRKFRASKATDSRDVVYALLGISSDKNQEDFIVPDYGRTAMEVTDATILYLLAIPHHRRHLMSLPKWTPNELMSNLDVLETHVLDLALHDGCEELARLLITSDRTASHKQWRLCIEATEGSRDDILSWLITDRKGLISATDLRNFTPLSYAACNGLVQCTKLLLKNSKVDVNAKDGSGRTALMRAVELGHTEIVRLLLENKDVDVNISDSEGQVLLGIAIQGFINIAERSRLFNDRTSQCSMVDLLLHSGKVDVNSRNSYGRTALSHAAEHGLIHVAESLYRTGGLDIDLADLEGRSPLSYAAQGGLVRYTDMAIFLLYKGHANIRLKDHRGWTPLWRAAFDQNRALVDLFLDVLKRRSQPTMDQVEIEQEIRIVRALMQRPGNKAYWRYVENYTPKTLLSFAVYMEDETVVKTLVDIGSSRYDRRDLDISPSPLCVAALKQNDSIVRILLGAGVDVDERPKGLRGVTALGEVASRGYEKMARILLYEGKADPHLSDDQGYIPLDYARFNNHHDIITLLENYDNFD